MRHFLQFGQSEFISSAGKMNNTLHWRHNDHDGASNHQPHGCLFNRFFQAQIKKNTSKLRVTGLCVGNSPGPVNSTCKGPVTRKMFPFDDVIVISYWHSLLTPIIFLSICANTCDSSAPNSFSCSWCTGMCIMSLPFLRFKRIYEIWLLL